MYDTTDAAFEHAVSQLVEAEHVELIVETRNRLLTHLCEAVTAMQQAAGSLEHLRGAALYDVEFAEGRDGRDIAALLDDGIRLTRAAYAMAHTAIDP